jgi:hypothetical protein
LKSSMEKTRGQLDDGFLFTVGIIFKQQLLKTTIRTAREIHVSITLAVSLEVDLVDGNWRLIFSLWLAR